MERESTHPSPKESSLGPRDRALENQLRLVGLCLFLLALPRFIALVLGVPTSPVKLVSPVLLVWAGVWFLRLGPHGRIAASFGLGLRVLPLINIAMTGIAAWYLLVPHLVFSALLLWFIWSPGAALFVRSYQYTINDRGKIHRVPLGSIGLMLLGTAIWAAQVGVQVLVTVLG